MVQAVEARGEGECGGTGDDEGREKATLGLCGVARREGGEVDGATRARVRVLDMGEREEEDEQ